MPDQFISHVSVRLPNPRYMTSATVPIIGLGLPGLLVGLNRLDQVWILNAFGFLLNEVSTTLHVSSNDMKIRGHPFAGRG